MDVVHIMTEQEFTPKVGASIENKTLALFKHRVLNIKKIISHGFSRACSSTDALLSKINYFGDPTILETQLFWRPNYFGDPIILETQLFWRPNYSQHVPVYVAS
jgi:hypothetical protein